MTRRTATWPRRGACAVLTAALLALPACPAAAVAATDTPWPHDLDAVWSDHRWHAYVLAPEGTGVDGRMVAPVAVLGASSAEEPEALLAADGRAARLTRAVTAGSARWPGGTTVAASSQRPGHTAAAAVDGDPATWWQDATPGVGPDTLTITTPHPVTLPGVTLVSSSRGWVADARVEVLAGGAWQPAGAVTGAATLTTPIPFAAPVTTARIRVTVLRAWSDPGFPLRQREHPKLIAVVPGLAGAAYIELDFGQEVAGRLEVRVTSASAPAPAVRIAVAERRGDLTPRSDYSHADYGPDRAAGGGDEGPGTELFVPDPGGQVWRATAACRSGSACTQGVRAFRYARVYLGPAEDGQPGSGAFGQVAIDAVSLRFTPFLGTPGTYDGWFISSDELLNRAWYASVYTAELVTGTVRAGDVDPRGCFHADLAGKVFYLDGAKRDRCPYGGGADIVMLANYVAHPDPAPITNQLHAFARRQTPDGWLPGSPLLGFRIRYPDAPGRWVTELHKYALWSGDLEFVRDHWPHLVGVLDTWYPRLTDRHGLAAGRRAPHATRRRPAGRGLVGLGGLGAPGLFKDDLLLSTEEVVALRNGAALGEALGGAYAASAARWRARAEQVAAAINRHLWDPAVGAYRQSPTRPCHPQWNALTVLSGVAGATRADRVLDHLQTLALPYGNPYNDNGDACPLLGRDSSRLVYGEAGAWETLARFRAGRDLEALDQLRRTYGWQLARDPGSTVWEGWGAPGGDPAGLFGRGFTSLAHGHMAGAAFVLTSAVLGVTPTGFGFTTYQLAPHPGDLAGARGVVPTPRGPVKVAWRRGTAGADRFDLAVSMPAGTGGRVGVPAAGGPVRVRVDGALVWDGASGYRAPGVRSGGGYVWLEGLGGGPHQVTSRPADPVQEAPAPGRNLPVSVLSGRPPAAIWAPRRNAATTAPRTMRPA